MNTNHGSPAGLELQIQSQIRDDRRDDSSDDKDLLRFILKKRKRGEENDVTSDKAEYKALKHQMEVKLSRAIKRAKDDMATARLNGRMSKKTKAALDAKFLRAYDQYYQDMSELSN